jgi:hypothetical protein
MLNDKIAYTDEMLATVFRRPVNTVRLALQTFEQFGMIEVIDGTICISNWEKHQNIEGMEKIREQNRLAQQRSRAKKKLLQASNSVSCDSHVTVMQCHATDIEEDKEKDIDIDKSNSVSQAKKRARFTPPTIEEVQAYCQERQNGVDAERFIDYYSSNGWMVGKNKMKDWKAAVRTWESNGYGNAKTASKGRIGNSSFDTNDFFEAAVARSWGEKEPPKTAADDDAIREKMEALKERLG